MRTRFLNSPPPPVSISVQISRVVIITAAVAVVLTMAAMIAVASLLAKGAAQQRARTIHSLPISCTASMGIGLYPEDGQSTNELMARADAAMYEAKARGRDQIRCVSDVSDVSDGRHFSNVARTEEPVKVNHES